MLGLKEKLGSVGVWGLELLIFLVKFNLVIWGFIVDCGCFLVVCEKVDGDEVEEDEGCVGNMNGGFGGGGIVFGDVCGLEE